MTNSAPKDLDLNHLLGTLRRATLPVLGVAALLAVMTYLYASSRPSVYQATASMSALLGGSSNSVLNNTLVTAPILPPAVVARAIRSPSVINQAISLIQADAKATPARQVLTGQLLSELHNDNFRTITLNTDVNQDFVGAYEVSARAATAELAQAAANSFVTAMLNWDRQRALQSITRARQNLTLQRDALSKRSAGSGLDERTLTGLRVNLAEKSQQVDVLEQTVSGTLSALASATLPVQPVEPKPARDAVLVFAAATFFGALIVFLLDALRRRVRLDDLQQFAAPVLGMLPPLPRRVKDAKQLTWQAGRGVFREQMDFVRVGLRAATKGLEHTPVVVISSALIGEGKSTTVVGLSANLAAHGQRVLVVDADVFRLQQLQLWFPAHQERAAANLKMANGLQLWFQTVPGVDVAAPNTTPLEVNLFAAAVREVSMEYDIVLVDTAPLLKVADTLALAAQFDGLVLVADANTGRSQVERAIQELSRLKIPLMGFVFNRFRETLRQNAYTYAYESVPTGPLDAP